MATERQCFHAKPKSWREKGCRRPAKYRVVMEGLTIDVCEKHVDGYRGMGYKVLLLEELTV